METILPIIVAIIIFAFQAYSNYQKEQEKARNRNPGQPRIPDESGEQYVEEYPFNEEEQAPIPDYWEKPVAQYTQEVKPVFDEYSGVVDEEELRRTRRSKTQQKQLIPQRLVVEEDGEDADWNGTDSSFDLRDAVIKSAILERPYQ